MVQRIMADLPSFDSKAGDSGDNVNLNKENADSIMNYINTMM